MNGNLFMLKGVVQHRMQKNNGVSILWSLRTQYGIAGLYRGLLQFFQQSFCFLNLWKDFSGGQNLFQLFTCFGFVPRFN